MQFPAVVPDSRLWFPIRTPVCAAVAQRLTSVAASARADMPDTERTNGS